VHPLPTLGSLAAQEFLGGFMAEKGQTSKRRGVRLEPTASTVASVIIALIGLIGSLGGAWITVGAKFDKELEKKDSELRELSSKIEELRKALPQDANVIQRLEGEVGKLEGKTSALADADLESRQVFGEADNKGTKACLVGSSGRWIDVTILPRYATAQQCEGLRNYEAGSSGVYKLGCLFKNGEFRWAEGGAPPSPNCGW
jgi:hypothetical protein